MKNSKPKILFFINPKSGSAKTDGLLDLIDEIFDESYEYEIVLPQKGRKIEEIISESLKKSFDIVSVSGGDGTVSAAAHALSNTSTLLSIIPTGTANVIANELGIPIDIRKSLELIKSDFRVRKLDALEVNGNFYYLRISVGLSSLTIKNITRRSKRILGSLAYLWKGIINYFSYNHRYFKVIIDGKKHKFKASDIVVTNFGRLFFPGINIDKKISPDDKVLDVFVFRPLKFKSIMKLLFGIVFQRKVRELKQFTGAKEIRIECKKRMPVQADGDIIGYTPVEVKIVPGALKVII